MQIRIRERYAGCKGEGRGCPDCHGTGYIAQKWLSLADVLQILAEKIKEAK